MLEPAPRNKRRSTPEQRARFDASTRDPGDRSRCPIQLGASMNRASSFLVPSRREFLRLLALAGVSGAARVSPLSSRVLAAPPLFEEIPGAASGISCVRRKSMSTGRYPPETMGPDGPLL